MWFDVLAYVICYVNERNRIDSYVIIDVIGNIMRRLLRMLFYLFVLLVMAMDQLSKLWIRIHMKVGDSMPFNQFIQLTYYENSGMAHSLFQGYGRLFAVVAILFIAGVLYYRRKGELRGAIMEIGAGFFVGGALGNAIDRIWFGEVTDFLEFRSGHGVLNLADVAINIGVLLIVIDTLVKYLKQHKGDQSHNKMNPIAGIDPTRKNGMLREDD
jgi:signal peptidase II